MIFKRKKISKNLSLSQRLKRARKRKKLSLADVEIKTKIREKYIESIENNNYKDLPNKVYIIGFLTTYANILGLDPKDIIEQYKREKGEQQDSAKEYLDLKKGINLPKYFLTSKVLISTALVILFLGFIGYLFLQIKGFAAQPKLELTEPKKDEIVTSAGGLQVSGNTDPGASIFINDQPVGLNLEGKFTEEVRLRDGINIIKITAINKINKETVKTITVSANLPAQVVKYDSSKEGVETGLTLEISVDPNPVWLSVDVDGKKVFQGVMLKGASQEFRADRDIVVNTGNAGSCHVKLNNKNLGTLGKEGEIKKQIRFTIDDIGKLTRGY